MTQFIDLNLKAADKAAMTKTLLGAGFIKDGETGTLYHPTASLQLLPPGMVTRPTDEVQVVDRWRSPCASPSLAITPTFAPLTPNWPPPWRRW